MSSHMYTVLLSLVDPVPVHLTGGGRGDAGVDTDMCMAVGTQEDVSLVRSGEQMLVDPRGRLLGRTSQGLQ